MHTLIWVTHKWENNYNCRGSSQQVRGPSPILNSPDQAVRPVKLDLEKARGLWKIEMSVLKGWQRISRALVYREEPLIWKKHMPDPAADLGESLRKAGGSWKSPWGHEHQWESFWGSMFYHVIAGAGKCQFVIPPLVYGSRHVPTHQRPRISSELPTAL